MSSEATQTPDSRGTSNNKKILRELQHQESEKHFSDSVEEQRSKNRLGATVLHHLFVGPCFNVRLPPLWEPGL